MIRAKRIALRLRWVLLVLWTLCFGVGIFWTVGGFFEFGAGLVGAPSVAISGPLYKFVGFGFDGSELEYLVLVTVYLATFFMTQWLFLRPRQIWKVKTELTGRPMKRSAISAAFAITLLSVGLVYSIWDLFDDIFDGFPFEFSNEASAVVVITSYFFLLMPLILWCFWSVIFCVYWRQSDNYTWLGRVIRALIAGSVLELFVAIPIYATRQEDCYCARGSYAGLVFGSTVLLWAFGPGVFILFVREKRRRDQLLNFEKDEVLENTE